jgi:predicted transposase YbfD/YdcC
METSVGRSLLPHFAEMSDPRVERTRDHLLSDLLALAICGVIGGADSWVEIEEFGKAKAEWFRSFLRLPHGIPSHDTFGRVFARLDPEEFQACFINWVQSLTQALPGEIIAVDGKQLRRSFDRASNKAAIHLVSAWANTQRLVLGQRKVAEKSNEITAIPALLRVLELAGCIVTIDAMGCQKEIAAQIVEQKADYILALKGNQGTLHEEVRMYFETARHFNFKQIAHSSHAEVEGDHGRIETRRCWVVKTLDWLTTKAEWKGLRSLVMVEATREVGAEVSVETRYYISSLVAEAAQFNGAVRGHWGIENRLHWVLDVAFDEDHCRIRKAHAPQNFAILRHVALNLLRQERTKKIGIKAKRLIAAANTSYLAKVLNN